MEGTELSDYKHIRSIYEYREMSIFLQLCNLVNIEPPYVLEEYNSKSVNLEMMYFNKELFNEKIINKVRNLKSIYDAEKFVFISNNSNNYFQEYVKVDDVTGYDSFDFSDSVKNIRMFKMDDKNIIPQCEKSVIIKSTRYEKDPKDENGHKYFLRTEHTMTDTYHRYLKYYPICENIGSPTYTLIITDDLKKKNLIYTYMLFIAAGLFNFYQIMSLMQTRKRYNVYSKNVLFERSLTHKSIGYDELIEFDKNCYMQMNNLVSYVNYVFTVKLKYLPQVAKKLTDIMNNDFKGCMNPDNTILPKMTEFVIFEDTNLANCTSLKCVEMVIPDKTSATELFKFIEYIQKRFDNAKDKIILSGKSTVKLMEKFKLLDMTINNNVKYLIVLKNIENNFEPIQNTLSRFFVGYKYMYPDVANDTMILNCLNKIQDIGVKDNIDKILTNTKQYIAGKNIVISDEVLNDYYKKTSIQRSNDSDVEVILELKAYALSHSREETEITTTDISEFLKQRPSLWNDAIAFWHKNKFNIAIGVAAAAVGTAAYFGYKKMNKSSSSSNDDEEEGDDEVNSNKKSKKISKKRSNIKSRKSSKKKRSNIKSKERSNRKSSQGSKKKNQK
jgi:hypothetical protein